MSVCDAVIGHFLEFLNVIGEPPEHPALHHGLHGLPLQVGEAGRVPESLGKGVAVYLQLGNLHTTYTCTCAKKC